MKCKKCGKELNNDARFCTECGEKVDSVNTVTEDKKEKSKEEKTEATQTSVVETTSEPKRIVKSMENDVFFCLLSIGCYIGGPILAFLLGLIENEFGVFFILSRLASLFPLAAYGLAIYAKVKYPKSQFAKVLLIIYLVIFVLAIIAVVIFIVSCLNALENCGSMGEILNLFY